MATLTFSDTLKGRVAYQLYSTAYASLESYQSAIIDNAAIDAFAIIGQVAKYLPGVLTDDPAPTPWEAWLVSEACAIAALSANDGRAELFRRRADRDREVAIQTYEFDTADDNTAGSLTLLEIRKYVAWNLVRKNIYPPLNVIDYAAQWALNEIWNMKNWGFKQRPVTITIATDETVTVSDSVSLDSLNTAKLWYTDSSGIGMSISWAGAEDMAARRAASTDTGRPDVFRVYWEDGTLTWQFNPAPDQEYTVRTEAIISGPPAITDETSTTPFAAYPSAFVPGILDMVLARVEVKLGAPDAERHMADALETVSNLFPQYESIGKPVTDGWAIRDVYNDWDSLGSTW